MTGCYIKGPKVVALQGSGSKLRGIWDFGFQGAQGALGLQRLGFCDLSIWASGL